MRLPRFASQVFVLVSLSCVAPAADVVLRWNQAGYAPDSPKKVIVLSSRDLSGERWNTTATLAPKADRDAALNANAAMSHAKQADATRSSPGAPEASAARKAERPLSGILEASLPAAPDHLPRPFAYEIDLTALSESGEYTLNLGRLATARIRVANDPYRELLHAPLQHLRVVRSGTHEVLHRRISHRGDARAPMHVPEGDPANGKWKPAADGATVDALGGWYDAGDQIKFTLNHAYTTYHLLFAYRLKPTLFEKRLSASELPDILDEARHGLEYLIKLHPSPDVFIIQVGNAEDHHQADRLPENDPLDGKRPALCALSRVHMGAAASALALGARVFSDLDRAEDAARYASKARQIYARARQPDTQATAFERDQVNDFYHDPTDDDQLALAAMELYSLTGDRRFVDDARAIAPHAGMEVSWMEWSWLANLALAPHDTAAKERLLLETWRYAEHAATRGAPWGLPTPYTWGSLHRWIGAANAARMTSRTVEKSEARDRVFDAILDYTFGRNNWGVSFLFSERLPNTLRHLYSPGYRLLGVFPTGALSEGPGERGLHESLERYFETPKDDPFHAFNTRAAVFFDHDKDFMCQEATIGGQSDIILMLTLASL